MEEAKRILKGVYYAQDAEDATKGADALVIVAEWNQFRKWGWVRMAKPLREPAQMQALGFRYGCVGRQRLC